MTLDELQDYLYKFYEDNNCDGSIPITISFYTCGQVTKEPLLEGNLEIIISETGEPSLNINAEDN